MGKEILVIGGGVIGLCTAYYCLMKGHQVTVLERGTPDHDSCSLGNAGMVVPSHFVPMAAPGVVGLALKWMWNPESPFYVRPRLDGDLLRWGWKFWHAATAAHVAKSAPILRDLHFASRALYEELASLHDLDFELIKKGLVLLCKTRHALDEESRTAGMARRLGIPTEVLDAKHAGMLDPLVKMNVEGAVYFPEDCHLSPHRFVAGLTRHLERAGARFLWQTEVSGWRRSGSRLQAAVTNQGDFCADEYVIAGGSWSSLLARDLGLRLMMQPGKGYSLTLPEPRRLPTRCFILIEARIAVTPMGSSLRFGGTMELAGFDNSITPARVNGMIQAVPEYFPEFSQADFADIRPWCGLRPCSPDGLPYLGRTARYANLAIATGHAMMGLSLGPISGKLVAEMLSGERSSLEIQYLDPDRYA